MPTTTTARMRQIADDLRKQGSYTSANSVDAITDERDRAQAAVRDAHNYMDMDDEQNWRADFSQAIKESER